MTPDEIISKIGLLGVNMTRRTLLNYEKWEVIPKPNRGGGGAGGRWTDYPDGTVQELYAAWALIHGAYGNDEELMIFGSKMPSISPRAVAFIRNDIISRCFEDKISPSEKVFSSYMKQRTLKVIKLENGVKVDFFGIKSDPDTWHLEAWLEDKYKELFMFAHNKLKTSS